MSTVNYCSYGFKRKNNGCTINNGCTNLNIMHLFSNGLAISKKGIQQLAQDCESYKHIRQSSHDCNPLKIFNNGRTIVILWTYSTIVAQL